MAAAPPPPTPLPSAPPPPAEVAAPPTRWLAWQPFLLLLLVTLLYGRVLLNGDTGLLLSGREVEWTVESDVAAWQSIVEHGELPLWNPYWHAGRPLLADPFFHGADPKLLLPMLLLGPINGHKIGVLLSFLVAGVGGLWLARVLRLGPVASAWLGVAMALCGHLVGYFTGVSSVGLGFSFAYVPWVIAATLALWQRPAPRPTALFALAVALLFLGSNFYFFAYTAVTLGVVVGLEGLAGFASRRDLAPLRPFVVHAAIGSALALALAAVVALPQAELSRYLFKPPLDPLQPAGQPLEALLVNFLLRDPAYYAGTLFNMGGSMIGHYSYLGALPFLFLLGVPLAWRVGQRRQILWLAAIGGIGLLYAAGSYAPTWRFFQALPGAASLRFPERALGLTSVAILALGALGLDRWWQRSRHATKRLTLSGLGEGVLWAAPVNPLRPLLLALMGASLLLLYRGNQPLLALAPRNEVMESAIVSTKQEVGARAFHLFVPVDFSMVATTRQRVGQINPSLVWVLDRPPTLDWFTVSHNIAEYALTMDDQPPPEWLGRYEKVLDLTGYDLYRLPDAMPFALVTSATTLPEPLVLEAPAHARPLVATRPSLRRIQVDATAEAGERILVAESFYPGWRVTVDGRPAPLEAHGGFLSTPAQPGSHRYHFYFDPWLPKLALLLTGLALPYTLAVVGRDRWGFGTRRGGVPEG